jgi:hypothetical protein
MQNRLKKTIYLIILVFGLMVGTALSWVYFYTHSQANSDNQQLLENLLQYANTAITNDNYACTGKPVKTVGATIASLLELNSTSKINSLSYGCFKETCTVSVTSCAPWQTNECSSRFLTFTIDGSNNIQPNTFSCFDLP